VLGANDGIVPVAGIVLGVAGPPRREAPYSPLGRRAWWPARCRWRSGEYVPVSSQPDSDKSLLARDRQELMEMPAAELDELAAI
jgi:vacuolar iron transporter family protein